MKRDWDIIRAILRALASRMSRRALEPSEVKGWSSMAVSRQLSALYGEIAAQGTGDALIRVRLTIRNGIEYRSAIGITKRGRAVLRELDQCAAGLERAVASRKLYLEDRARERDAERRVRAERRAGGVATEGARR